MRNASRAAWCAAGALWLSPAAAQAQAPTPAVLTLAVARDSARRHSPELAAMRHAVASAAGRERQAGAWPNPTLSYGREQTSLEGETSAQDIVSLDQPVARPQRPQAAGATVRAALHAREPR